MKNKTLEALFTFCICVLAVYGMYSLAVAVEDALQDQEVLIEEIANQK
jgi:hypothetical protein